MLDCNHICKGDGQCNSDVLASLLQEKEELLNSAGECGLKLQELLHQTQQHMEEQRVHHEHDMEEKVQELYELKIKLDCSERSLQDNKMISQQAVEVIEERMEKECEELQRKLNVASREKVEVVAQLNQLQLTERQLNELVEALEEKNATLMNDKQKKPKEVDISYSQEVFVLHEQVISLEEALELSRSEETKMKNKLETLTLSVKTLQTSLEDKSTEVETAEQKNTALFNHLEKSREETKEVRAELEMLKVQLQQSGHLKKGNSLFGEVEDERLGMEKKLKTMEVRYDSMAKAHSFLKNQHHNLKSQVTALLSLHSGKADLDHINNLERSNSQLKSENVELRTKLKDAEGKSGAASDVDELVELGQRIPEHEGSKDMVQLLTIKLDEVKEENRKLKVELDKLHMVKMCESDKLQSAEQKLHDTGLASEKFKNANMKLRLKLEDVESKYKAEHQKRILIEKKFNYDSSHDVEPIGVGGSIRTRSPPPFVKQQQKNQDGKFRTSGDKKVQSKPPSGKSMKSSLEWSEVLKTIKESQNNLNHRPTQDGSSAAAATTTPSTPSTTATPATPTTHERKVSFKEDMVEMSASPLPTHPEVEEEEEEEEEQEEEQKENLKKPPELSSTQPPSRDPPSSCLKKSSSGRNNKTMTFNEPKAAHSGLQASKMKLKTEKEDDCHVQ